MNKHNLEKELKVALIKHSESYIIPSKESILKLCGQKNISTKNFGRVLSWRKIVAMTAAMSLFVCMVFALTINYINNYDKVLEKINYIDDVPSWYSTNTIQVNTSIISMSASQKYNVNSFSNDIFYTTQLGSKLSTNKEINIPDWVTSTENINDRYLNLYYSNKPDEYSSSSVILLDTQTGIILGLEDTILQLSGIRNPEEWMPYNLIKIVNFTTSNDWCVFNYFDFSDIEVTENAENLPNLKTGMINLSTNVFCSFPFSLNYDDCAFISLSSSGDYIVYRKKADESDNAVSKVFVYNTQTQTTTDISSVNGKMYVSGGYAVFSDSERYIISYVYGDKEVESIWDTIEANWIIYDTLSGNLIKGNGKIIRFTSSEDALVVQRNEGAVILSLEDGSDITSVYKLKTYERYILCYTLDNGIFTSVYLKNIFGESDTVELGKNIAAYYVTGDFIYLYEYGTNVIICYSFSNNEYFTASVDPSFVIQISQAEKAYCRIYTSYDGKIINLITTLSTNSEKV